MPSIGKLALQITADATDFIGTLEKVQRRVTAFATTLATKFTQPFRLLTDPFRSIEAGLKSFFDLAGEGSDIKRIADVGRAADKLGTSTQTLLAIARAARSDVSEMVGPIFRATAAMGKMGNVAEEVTTPLEKWGIDIKKIQQSTDPVAALFEAVAEKMPEASNKAELAMAAFGRGGLAMIEALQKGKGGLADLKAMMAMEGNLFSRADAQRAIDAAAAVGKLKKSFEGIKTQLAISFAPLIAEIAKGIQGWIDSMGGGRAIAEKIRDVVLDIAEGILSIAEAIASMIANVEDFLKSPGMTSKTVAELVGRASGEDLTGGLPSSNEAGKVQVQFDKVRETLEKMRQPLEGNTEQPLTDFLERYRQGIKVAVDEQIHLGAQAQDLGTKLQNEASMFGITGHQAEIMKLKLEGASEAQLEVARSAAKVIADFEDDKALRDFGKTLEEEILTPFDKWQQKLEEINEYIARGGSVETGLLAIAKATDTFQESMKSPLAGPAALLQGSSAAVSAVTAAFAGTQDRSNPFKTATEILARQEALQRETRDEIRRLVQLDIPDKDPQGNVIPP